MTMTMRATTISVLLALCIVVPSVAAAQDDETAPAEPQGPETPEPAPELETKPEASYLSAQTRWPAQVSERDAAFVDRRLEIDAMAGQSILWPTAYTAEAGTFTYTNFFLLGNTVNFAVTDNVSLGATIVFPSLGALHLQGTGRIRVHDGPNHIISIVPVVHYQSEGENELLTTAAVSTGVGVVSDFYITDRLLVGAGLHLHTTLAASTSSVENADCPDRDAFFRDGCTEVTRDWQGLPPGGHWAALVGHAIYYIDDWINLRAEAFTGGVAGTFLGAEYIYGRETLAERSERYQDGDFALGVPYDSSFTFGLGTGLTTGNISFQLSAYVYSWEEALRVTPMFAGAITF